MNPTRCNGEATIAKHTKGHQADKKSRQKRAEDISTMPAPPPKESCPTGPENKEKSESFHSLHPQEGSPNIKGTIQGANPQEASDTQVHKPHTPSPPSRETATQDQHPQAPPDSPPAQQSIEHPTNGTHPPHHIGPPQEIPHSREGGAVYGFYIKLFCSNLDTIFLDVMIQGSCFQDITHL